MTSLARISEAPAVTHVHDCPACRRPFVVPLDVIAVLHRRAGYVMKLGCTNCGDVQVGQFDEATMAALDEHLDRTVAKIASDAASLRRILDEERVQRFAVALRQGHLLPEDF